MKHHKTLLTLLSTFLFITSAQGAAIPFDSTPIDIIDTVIDVVDIAAEGFAISQVGSESANQIRISSALSILSNISVGTKLATMLPRELELIDTNSSNLKYIICLLLNALVLSYREVLRFNAAETLSKKRLMPEEADKIKRNFYGLLVLSSVATLSRSVTKLFNYHKYNSILSFIACGGYIVRSFAKVKRQNHCLNSNTTIIEGTTKNKRKRRKK